MDSTKIIGWLLLACGLLIIFYSLFSSLNIFTGKSQPPQVFKPQEEGIGLQEEGAESMTLEEKAESIAREEFQNQFQKMIPGDAVIKTLNLLSWSIFSGILIFGGSHISGLGINLLKKSVKVS